MTSNSISMESGKKCHSRFKLQFLLFVHSPLIGVLKKKLKKQKQKNKKQIFVNDKDTKKKKKIKTIGEKTHNATSPLRPVLTTGSEYWRKRRKGRRGESIRT